MTEDQFRLWAAGFFDGEGCVTIWNNGEFYHTLVAEVTQLVREPLDALQVRYGGSVSGPRKNHCYRWTIRSREAAKFLSDIRPFLLVKGKAADLGMELQSRNISGRNGGSWSDKVARTAEGELRRSIKKRLQEHNFSRTVRGVALGVGYAPA